MSKKDSTEYLYLSTRVRALEGGTVGHDRMESLIETKNLPDAMAKLASFGTTARPPIFPLRGGSRFCPRR